ncbi:hypothetical protein [Bifidobacterium myosotis]|uniref:Uncharacterized protein n=1 Tax=Bifidobacterium myosotis TaxID=1630166 RepID=A0A5M9ZP72_9BIFI|nr:hypothetical protein [Bifidobacterium myosotis]KAA8829457.1 hypothetical protein EMO91_00055 [Bifidobacterium myosotis]
MSADDRHNIAAGAAASGGGVPAGSGRPIGAVGRRFTPEQTAYLNALPAVATCDGRRIVYTDGFRERCMARYAAGELPTDLFREAGLDPELVGAKRIGRAFARWRKAAGVPARAAGRPVAHGEPKRSDGEADLPSVDPRDAVILAQARLIDALTAQVAELEQRLARAERR